MPFPCFLQMKAFSTWEMQDTSSLPHFPSQRARPFAGFTGVPLDACGVVCTGSPSGCRVVHDLSIEQRLCDLGHRGIAEGGGQELL